jgi:hypothetical protein
VQAAVLHVTLSNKGGRRAPVPRWWPVAMNVDLVSMVRAAVPILRLAATGTRDKEVERVLVLLLGNFFK